MTEDNITKKNKSFCKNCHDRNYLIECKCGCGQVLFRRDSNRALRYFIKGHNSNGMGNNMYKSGRYFHKSSGYWYLTGIYDHPNSDRRGRIAEHIYNFTMFHKCCMLPWGIVHHIDENKENNMPWNLRAIMRVDHMTIHLTKDMSDRRCEKCGSDKTGTNWYTYKDGFICNKCYMKDWWLNKMKDIGNQTQPFIPL